MSYQNDPHVAAQLLEEVYIRYSLTMSPTWLSDYVSAVRNPAPPLPALASTANFRLLNSDFTRSLSSSRYESSPRQGQPQLLPLDIANVNVKQSQLSVSIPVQVLDIIDIGSSKMSQIEAIERIERGEEIKGREIVRNVPMMNEEDGSERSLNGVNPATNRNGQNSVRRSNGPHKLLLQDAAGTRIWGFELVSLPKVFITGTAEDGGLQIGAKILLKKGLLIRRGLAMLEPTSTILLGGKVEQWDTNWRLTRKQMLASEVERENMAPDVRG